MCLIRGQAADQNRSLGLKIIKDGLLDNHASGWGVLSDCHRYGYGVPRNMAKAVMCYVRGASSFDGLRIILHCNIALAEMYETGEGLAIDLEQAAHYYQIAANRMDALSQWKTAQFYESGIAGKEQNRYRAFDYFHKAARAGHKLAMRKAGEYYMKGIGVQRDRSMAERYIREAIDRGDDQAMRLLRSGCLI